MTLRSRKSIHLPGSVRHSPVGKGVQMPTLLVLKAHPSATAKEAPLAETLPPWLPVNLDVRR